MDEKKKEEIRNKAKEILDKFSKSLAKVEINESNVIREEDRRQEGEGRMEKNLPNKSPSLKDSSGCDSEFREIMFENAPKKDKDFIIAEKKTWN